MAHEGAKRGPKVAPDGPKMSQDGSKVAEGPQDYPKKAQEEDKMAQDRVSYLKLKGRWSNCKNIKKTVENQAF